MHRQRDHPAAAAPPPGRLVLLDAAGGAAATAAASAAPPEGSASAASSAREELVGRLEAVRRVLGERAQDDRVERRRDLRVELATAAAGCSETCFSATATGGLGLERDPAGERLVEDHADRVEVGGGGRLEALGLLGREVLGGAEHRAGLGDLRGAGAGDAEVGDPRAALAVDEHVLRLEVAVDDPALVRELAPARIWRIDLDRLADRRARARSGP